MFPLDPKTLDRLVEIAIDRDGTHERTGRELERLLVRAAWPGEPFYDGSYKFEWLRETLDEHADDRGAIERFICRLCDPIEYNDTDTPAATAAVFREAVNAVLAPEGLVVSDIAERPVLGELGRNGETPTYGIPADLSSRLTTILSDDATVQFLAARAGEARRAEEAGAFTLAVIGIGSLTEGLLATFLNEHDVKYRNGQLRVQRRNGGTQRVNPDRPDLSDLIDVAHAQGWIQLDAKRFLHEVREFRNFIHPQRHLTTPVDFDNDSVVLCWAPVHAVLTDLENALALKAV